MNAASSNSRVMKEMRQKTKQRDASTKSISTWIGGLMVLSFVVLALFAPILAPLNPNQIDLAARLAPIGTTHHALGTDTLGRDILSRLIWGARVTLGAAVGSSTCAMTIGVTMGIAAGMNQGTLDNLLMRMVDFLMSFPAMLLAMLIVAFIGPSLFHAMIAVTIANIPFYARLTRSVTISLHEHEFISASIALGNSPLRTAFRHVLPNISPYVISQGMMNVGWMILETTSLSFLGLGVQPPTPDWGSMLAEMQTVVSIDPIPVAIPGICIFLLVIGFNLLGEGLTGTNRR